MKKLLDPCKKVWKKRFFRILQMLFVFLSMKCYNATCDFGGKENDRNKQSKRSFWR